VAERSLGEDRSATNDGVCHAKVNGETMEEFANETCAKCINLQIKSGD